MKPKLNVKKIKNWLELNQRSAGWLARQVGVIESVMYYRLDSGSLIDIDKISEVIGIKNPKDLIEMVDNE